MQFSRGTWQETAGNCRRGNDRGDFLTRTSAAWADISNHPNLSNLHSNKGCMRSEGHIASGGFAETTQKWKCFPYLSADLLSHSPTNLSLSLSFHLSLYLFLSLSLTFFHLSLSLYAWELLSLCLRVNRMSTLSRFESYSDGHLRVHRMSTSLSGYKHSGFRVSLGDSVHNVLVKLCLCSEVRCPEGSSFVHTICRNNTFWSRVWLLSHLSVFRFGKKHWK